MLAVIYLSTVVMRAVKIKVVSKVKRKMLCARKTVANVIYFELQEAEPIIYFVDLRTVQQCIWRVYCISLRIIQTIVRKTTKLEHGEGSSVSTPNGC